MKRKSPQKSDNTHQSHISRFFFKAGTSTDTDNEILENAVENNTKTKNQKASNSQVGQSFEREKDNESEAQDIVVFDESENETEVQDPTVSVESEFSRECVTMGAAGAQTCRSF